MVEEYNNRIENKLSWSIVSKASDKSKITLIDPLSLPTVMTISLHTHVEIEVEGSGSG